MGTGVGMFQPQPTPYHHSQFSHYGLHVIANNAGIPDYTFAATPLLGQFGGGGGGHGGGSTSSNSDAGANIIPGVISGRGGPGPSTAGRAFTAVPARPNFHASASSGPAAGGGMAGAGVRPVQAVQPVQGLGSPTAHAHGHGTVATGTHGHASHSDNSAGYSSNSASSSIHPGRLYNLPMPVSVPHHQHQHHHPHPSQQQHHHHRPQRQNQPPPPPLQQHQPQRHPHQHQGLPPHSLVSDRATTHYKMDQQLDLDPNEIAQQEAAARDFEPQLEGPLVGEKVSSQAITAEYARADPTYVAKTMVSSMPPRHCTSYLRTGLLTVYSCSPQALPQTYSHYRPIQGDGNCGWRAIAFAYFEILIQRNDINLVQTELQRMTNLNKYIEDVGGQEPTIVELMVEETLALFSEIVAAMSEGKDPMPSLVAKFNESSTSQCLVYHLRLLAGARLKEDTAKYEPYLDGDVESYLQTTVMPVNREIDHICVVLVHDILLAPANIVLEIAYLDRSEGAEVNVHRLPEGANGQDSSTLGPTIYLLYRPGHYDILYRDTTPHVPVPPAPLNLQVNRVTYNETFENPVPPMQDTSYTMDMSPLAMIPGLTSSLGPFGPQSTATPSPMADLFAPSPASSWVSRQFTPEVASAPPPAQPSPPQATVHPLRFSKYNFPNLPEMAAENNNTYEPAFTTNTFKNSHFNTAHYNNQNFQPEMYHPDAEEEAPSNGTSKTGGRKRSTENCLGIKKEK
ncbi:peptidase C65 Otubain-domain-containing protein [Nemania abortiva]|nr:peptidase C65 Otubain-domain-containing protein [Nemania abortiva]